MRASKYFDNKILLSLEDVLFQDIVQENTRYSYCLINEAMKTFYISESVAVAGVIARLRLIVKGATYPLIAHHVQGLAETSNMVDWVMAVFKPKVSMDDVVAKMKKLGYEQQFRETPYGVNGVENIRVYCATFKRGKLHVFFTSVNEPGAKVNMEPVRRVLGNHIAVIEAQARAKFKKPAAALVTIREHTHNGEWTVNEVDKDNLTTINQFRKHVAALNHNEAIRFATEYK